MDFTGQKSGGSSSDGANLVPASDFSASKSTQKVTTKKAESHGNFQPASAMATQPFAAQNDLQAMSNTDNVDPTVATNTAVNTTADNSDLIEKEWVLKAKSIVENTQNNPFLQSQKIAELRTEYLQSRYGKSLREDDK